MEEKQKSLIEDDLGKKLMENSEQGNEEAVANILKRDPSLVSYKDEDGYTALHRACYEDNPTVTRFLISSGADVTAVSSERWTPLHSACRWNAYRCVRLLLENGADVNARTNGGQTPLHLACSNRSARETITILLMEPVINVDIKNSANETAFDLARRSGSMDKLFEIHRNSIRII